MRRKKVLAKQKYCRRPFGAIFDPFWDSEGAQADSNPNFFVCSNGQWDLKKIVKTGWVNSAPAASYSQFCVFLAILGAQIGQKCHKQKMGIFGPKVVGL